jgi:hypothetical protein
VRYEVLISPPVLGSKETRIFEVEADDELTAAFRAGICTKLHLGESYYAHIVLGIRSEEEAA